jgi:hypothetical protein
MNELIKNKISTNHQTGRIKLSGRMVNPKRDWKILLIALIVFIISAIGFDYYVYSQIMNGDMYVSVQKNEIVVENLNKNSLQKISDIFNGKKATVANLKVENLPDPSL